MVFEDALPADLEVRWSAKLQRTAGQCLFREVGGARLAVIELSEKVLDTEDRLRKTLAHEMCHAAQWLLDGERKPPHGPAFKKHARAFGVLVPGMAVSTCHDYEIHYKFRYGCVSSSCGYEIGRQSKSVDLDAARCPRCMGRLTLLGTFHRDGTQAKQREPSAFAVYVKAHFSALKARLPAATHKELMGELGRRFREEKAANAISNGAGARPSNARLADLSECVAVDEDEEAAAATAAAEEEERLLDEAVAALHLA